MTEVQACGKENAAELTGKAYLWTKILNTPFWAIYNMLPFILYKDLHATPFQIFLIIALKPFVSIFSMYWGDGIRNRSDRLRSNLMIGGLLGHLPFLLIPWISNAWFLILSSGIYMMLARGVVPAWMEVLKQNIPRGKRERVFAYASALGYVGGGVLPFPMGIIMDHYFLSWRWIFLISALLSMGALFFQLRIPHVAKAIFDEEADGLTFVKKLLRPWKNVLSLLANRPDFTRYQMGFMLGGAGLIIMQPALPNFFVDALQLSYTEMAVALTLCKGIGFGMTFPLWARLINRYDIYRFNSWVTLVAFLFPIFLITAQYHLAGLFFAYLSYGVMQAGSELSWNMSGPIFAKEEDSSVFTNVNLVTVGIRGCFVPAIGTFLLTQAGAVPVMLCGGILCLLATAWMAFYSRTSTHEALVE